MSLSVKNSCGGKSLPELTNPATASDIASGKQAIDGDGNILIGDVAKATFSAPWPATLVYDSTNDRIDFTYEVSQNYFIDSGVNIRLMSGVENFGNATAADVAAGKTFTSAAGLKVEGTLNTSPKIEDTINIVQTLTSGWGIPIESEYNYFFIKSKESGDFILYPIASTVGSATSLHMNIGAQSITITLQSSHTTEWGASVGIGGDVLDYVYIYEVSLK